jgi:GntR family transcriptional regulator, transcriptional repressor for pyruvate dehydrogenase complex
MSIGPIKVEKGFEILANDLRERILSGAIRAGESLPNERELGDQTGLSRGSVREALRILEAQGLVSTKAGRYGGRVALQPTNEFLRTSIQSFIRGRQVPFTTLIETAESIEPVLASLAAQHRTDADLATLRIIGDELETSSVASEIHAANARWHLAVARASHNHLLIGVAEALNPLIHDPHVENFASAEIRDAVVRAHERVYQAIVDRDAEAAGRRMARHIRAYRTRIETVAPETVTIS